MTFSFIKVVTIDIYLTEKKCPNIRIRDIVTDINIETITFDFIKPVTIGIYLTGKYVILYEFVTFYNCR